MQALDVHSRVRGVGMPQVVEPPRIRRDPGHVARLRPEPVNRPIGQRSFDKRLQVV